MPQAIAAAIVDFTVDAIVAAGNAIGLDTATTIAIATAGAGVVTGAPVLIATIAINAALAPSIPKPESGRQLVKQSIPPRYRGYGRARLSGPVMLDAVNTNVLYRVISLHDGRIDGFEDYYLNDDLVALVGVNVQETHAGAYPSNLVRIETRLGAPTETAYASLVSERPELWSNLCRGDGIASAYLRCQNGKLTYFNTWFPNGKPNLSIVTRQSVVYDWRDGTQSQTNPASWKFSTNPIVCWVHELWAHRGPDYDWTTRFLPVLSALTAEANICDQPISVITVRGMITLYAENESTSVLLDRVDGLAVGSTIQLGNPTEILTVTGISGLNVTFTPELAQSHPSGSTAAWSVASGLTVTEPRYQVGGGYNCDARLADIVTSFREACDGFMARNGDGTIVIKCGHYEAPTDTIGPSEIIDYAWQSYVERERACNTLDVRYVSPAHGYNQVQTDAWQDLDDVSAVGEERVQQFAPGWVQWNSQARRLAKRKLSQMQAGYGTIRVKLSGLRMLGKRYILVNVGSDDIEELQNAVVEVYDTPQINEDGLSVTFPIRMADPNIDTWNPSTEEGEGPPVPGGRLGATPLAQPAITNVTPFFDAVSSTGAGVRLSIAASGPARDDLTWSWRWRVTGEVSWKESTDTSAEGGTITLTSDFVPANAELDVEVAYSTGAGSLSSWSATFPTNTDMDVTVPDPITSVSVSSWNASLNLMCAGGARAAAYRWRIYKSDETALLGIYVTTTPSFSYTSAQAAQDGVQRAYYFEVEGENAAGPGASASNTASLAAPPTIVGASASGGAAVGEITFTEQGPPGYLVAYSNTSGFNPSSYGASVKAGGSPAYLYGLAAGTYYARVAAYDAWSSNAAFLNFSAEQTFTITTGGGSTPPGGGVGGGAGGGGSFDGGKIDVP